MKNLQTITLPKIVLYGPDMLHRDEIKAHLNNTYNHDSYEFREIREKGQRPIALLCKSLTYTIDDSGTFIVIEYTIGNNEIVHTIITNDTFYIDVTEDT